MKLRKQSSAAWQGVLLEITVVLAVFCSAHRAIAVASSAEMKAQADGLFEHGKFKEAAAQYEQLVRACANDPETAAYARFQQGLCRLKDKREPEAFAAWAQLRLFHPNSQYVPRALWLELENSTNPIRSAKMCEEVLAKYPTSSEAAKVLLRQGQAALDRKDYPTARKLWTQFVDVFPRHESVAKIQKKLELLNLTTAGDLESIDHLEVESLLPRADALFDRAQFAEAAKLYQRIVARSGPAQDIGHPATRLAQCQMAEGNSRQAFETLQRALDKSPAGAPALLVELVSQSAARREGDELRLRATNLLVDRYPNRFEAQQALFIAGWVESIRKNPPQAEKWWTQLLERYPQTPFRAEVEKKLKVRTPLQPRLKAERQLPFTEMRPAVMSKQPTKLPEPPRETAEKKQSEQQARWQAEARGWAKRYGDAAAGEEQRAEAAFQMAERSFYLQQYEVAAQQFQRVWSEFPKSGRAEQAAFELAQMWIAAGDAKKGCEQLRFVANRFPSGSLRPLALYCLGNRFVLHESDAKAGWACFEQLMTEYPEHPLTQRTQKFWALLNKYPPEKLEAQLTVLRTRNSPTSK